MTTQRSYNLFSLNTKSRGTTTASDRVAALNAQPVVKTSKRTKAVQKHMDYTPIDRNKYASLTSDAAKLLGSLKDVDITASRLFFLTPSEILTESVCECSRPNESIGSTFLAYDPREGTIDDPRLGPLYEDMACGTCSQNKLTCTGHIGHIDFGDYPVVHPLRRTVLTQILNLFCTTCGVKNWTDEILEAAAHLPMLQKIKFMSEKCYTMKQQVRAKNGHDGHAKVFFVTNPTRSSDSEKERKKKKVLPYSICQSDDSKAVHTIKEQVHEFIEYLKIIEDVSQDDLKILGFRSKDPKSPISLQGFIMKRIPVLPAYVRHFGQVNGEKTPSELTRRYQDILNKKELLTFDTAKTQLPEFYNAINDLYIELQEQIKGKEGYIRGLSMGKRVDYSGRSVLNPYNRMKFGYVAYPARMKKVHTLPITLNDYNIKMMVKLLNEDGVRSIILGPENPKQGTRVITTPGFIRKYVPRVGDIFEIEGRDGDETMFNRQPTLDRLAIMGYKALYIDDPLFHCIGLHSSYNTPHNADYDGDEGNKHKIQTLDARSEIRHIASVENNIMNHKSNKPTMGLVYNCISSGYLISDEDAYVKPEHLSIFSDRLEDKEHLASLPDRLAKHGVSQTSGRAVFSYLLPVDFVYDRRENKNDKEGVHITNGVLVQGRLTGKHLGPSQGSIVHNLWKFYGKARTVRFFTEAQYILDDYIEYYGFSVGISSLWLKESNRILSIVDQTVEMSIKRIEALGPITNEMSSLEKEVRESKVQQYLNTVSRIGVSISKDALGPMNPINVMMKSGAKGKASNTAQILGALGQQYVQGSRPVRELTEGTRCLPYFEPNSEDIDANGFVKQSFLTGSDPGGFIFHMMASRIGLMDSALKTAEIGHMHHRIVKSLEDLVVQYDGSVRNGNNTIFSFSYSDGFSAAEIVPTKSREIGTTLSFIDIKEITAKLNAEE
jgi:DNA-directed RNA polymerase beta' subunit